MHNTLRELILWTWCLPQTLLGFVLFSLVKYENKGAAIKDYKGITIVRTKSANIGCVALGKYNFITDKEWKARPQTIEHEYGHTIQNYIFGPIYLIVIGVPSVFWLALSHVSPYIKKTYRTRYPENWADKLGKIKAR